MIVNAIAVQYVRRTDPSCTSDRRPAPSNFCFFFNSVRWADHSTEHLYDIYYVTVFRNIHVFVRHCGNCDIANEWTSEWIYQQIAHKTADAMARAVAYTGFAKGVDRGEHEPVTLLQGVYDGAPSRILGLSWKHFVYFCTKNLQKLQQKCVHCVYGRDKQTTNPYFLSVCHSSGPPIPGVYVPPADTSTLYLTVDSTHTVIFSNFRIIARNLFRL